MTTSMQQSEKMWSMVPEGGETSPPNESHVQYDRAVHPQTSIEDYSRVMLEYTHNRMASFADTDPDKGFPVRRSSRSSAGSGDSASGSGIYRRGPAPTSVGDTGVSHHDFGDRGGLNSTRDGEQSSF